MIVSILILFIGTANPSLDQHLPAHVQVPEFNVGFFMHKYSIITTVVAFETLKWLQ